MILAFIIENHTIYDKVDEEANIIFGTTLDKTLGNQIKISVIATDFAKDKEKDEAVQAQIKPTENKPWLRDSGISSKPKQSDKGFRFDDIPCINRGINIR